MNTLEKALSAFDAKLQPHERYAIAQGRLPPPQRQPHFPEGFCAVYEMDAEFTAKRRAAQLAAAEAFDSLDLYGWPNGRRMVDFAVLLGWAVAELRLNTVSSFAGFALLLRAMSGDKALPLAAPLFAAACHHPTHFHPSLLVQSTDDMDALHEALFAPASPLPVMFQPALFNQLHVS